MRRRGRRWWAIAAPWSRRPSCSFQVPSAAIRTRGNIRSTSKAIIGRALATAGTDFAHVVRVTYYLADRADFEPCWPQLRAAFGAHPPASTVIFADLLDPAMKIEIEVTAALPAS